MNNSIDECQPCDNFSPEYDYFSHREHQCPLCEGWRVFCNNCHTDHHRGGWNTCNHNPIGGPRVCGRNHPKCLEAADVKRDI